MSRAVPLSRIQELGIRGREDPAAQPVVWNVITMDDGSLRALHEALHPTLLLLALAGYRIDQLVLGPPDESGDILLVEALAAFGDAGRLGGLHRERIRGVALLGPVRRPRVAQAPARDHRRGRASRRHRRLAGHFVMVEGFPFLGYDITTLGFLNLVLYGLTWEQDGVRATWRPVSRRRGPARTGTRARPGCWRRCSRTCGPSRTWRTRRTCAARLRQLGEPIAGSALTTNNALETFLLEEAVVRDGDQPPSVHDRLVVLVPDDAADLERNWNSEAEALWNEHNRRRRP